MDRLVNEKGKRADRREKPVADASPSDRRGCLRLATSLHRLSETFEVSRASPLASDLNARQWK